MKYDDASWHYGGDFPKDLPLSAGGTHIGMFVSWALLRGLAGAIHLDELPDTLEKLRRREETPGAWFLNTCDEKFTEEDLNQVGNEFAAAYYGADGSLSTHSGSFLSDYEATFAECEDLYRVPDTWHSFDRIASVLESRFDQWKSTLSAE